MATSAYRQASALLYALCRDALGAAAQVRRDGLHRPSPETADPALKAPAGMPHPALSTGLQIGVGLPPQPRSGPLQPIIITGSSRGIGAETAKLAGSMGYAVCVNYRINAEGAQRVARTIEEAGGHAFAHQADCTDEAAVRAMFDATAERYGEVHALVNNAAVLGPRAPLADLDIADVRAVVETNLVGVIICAREAVRRMSHERGGRGGVIVNLSSVAARHGSPGNCVHYAATKGAIDTFTLGLSKEVIAQGIRVNAVSPGVTVTAMNPIEQATRAAASLPIGRPAEPIEIAHAIMWLVSPAASYVVGANLLVAGGRS